jgi:hypothetical protein
LRRRDAGVARTEESRLMKALKLFETQRDVLRIGFTGTEYGMGQAQFAGFVALMMLTVKAHEREVEFHHGDCVGSDEEAHNWVAANLDPFMCSTVAHPGLNEEKRAYCKATEIREPMDNLARNAIVAAQDILIATPHTIAEYNRSGTWHTVRTFAKISRVRGWRPIYIVKVNGIVQTHFYSEVIEGLRIEGHP